MLRHYNTVSKDPSRVVVVGSNGFVGSSLLHYLNNCGINTLGLSLRKLLESPQNISYIINMLREDDVVVMLSAITPDKVRNSGLVETFNKNIQMAQLVCDVLKKKVCSQVVYFSSDSVYSYEDLVISEMTVPNPQSSYGKMHLMREQMFQENIRCPLLIFRSTQIYGALDPHNSYGPCRMLRSAIYEEKISLFGDGVETRDHIFIEDIIKLLVILLKYRSFGIVNGATGASISFAKIASIVREIVGNSVAISSIPTDISITHRSFDISLFKKALGGYFKCIPLKEGITEIYQKMYKKFVEIN